MQQKILDLFFVIVLLKLRRDLLSRYRHFERSAAKSRNLLKIDLSIPLRFSRDDDFSYEYINGRYEAFFGNECQLSIGDSSPAIRFNFCFVDYPLSSLLGGTRKQSFTMSIKQKGFFLLPL